jgi:hypothetical protein
VTEYPKHTYVVRAVSRRVVLVGVQAHSLAEALDRASKLPSGAFSPAPGADEEPVFIVSVCNKDYDGVDKG